MGIYLRTQGELLSLYNVRVEGDRWGSAGRRFGVCVRKCPALVATSCVHASLSGANMAAMLLPYTHHLNAVSMVVLLFLRLLIIIAIY